MPAPDPRRALARSLAEVEPLRTRSGLPIIYRQVANPDPAAVDAALLALGRLLLGASASDAVDSPVAGGEAQDRRRAG